MSESLQRLRELVQLLESGHISREEFEQAKQKALAEEQPILDSTHDSSLPTKVGPYRLLGLIGEGGMGRVFRAQHDDSTIREQQGGEVLSSCFMLNMLEMPRPPNDSDKKRPWACGSTTPVLSGVGTGRGWPTERLGHGICARSNTERTLGASKRSRSLVEAKPVLTNLVEAVNYAHISGVVHRDLKPDNIILTNAGSLKILDFGIAKSENANLTQTGYGLGTADYMAPEQFTDAKGRWPRRCLFAGSDSVSDANQPPAMETALGGRSTAL